MRQIVLNLVNPFDLFNKLTDLICIGPCRFINYSQLKALLIGANALFIFRHERKKISIPSSWQVPNPSKGIVHRLLLWWVNIACDNSIKKWTEPRAFDGTGLVCIIWKSNKCCVCWNSWVKHASLNTQRKQSILPASQYLMLMH